MNTPGGPATELKVEAVKDTEWRQRAETAEAELARLQTESAYLKKENETLLTKYVQLTRTMNEELENARKRVEDAQKSPALPRANSDKLADAALCQRFGLPSGDFAVTTYTCRDRDSKPGTMTLTPTHVCFETSAPVGFLFGSYTVAFPLIDIVSVNKVKASILPGSQGHSLEFQLADGRVMLFRAYIHREECVADIRMLADRVNSQRPAGRAPCLFYAHGVLENASPAPAGAAKAP